MFGVGFLLKILSRYKTLIFEVLLFAMIHAAFVNGLMPNRHFNRRRVNGLHSKRANVNYRL